MVLCQPFCDDFILLICVLDIPGPSAKPSVKDVCSTKVTVSWTKPKFDGGTTILGYILECRSVPSQDWTKCNASTITDTTYTVTGLEENTTYQFKIAAENKLGIGPFGEESQDVTTLGKKNLKSAKLLGLINSS